MWELQVEECVFRGDSCGLVSVLRDEGLTASTLTRLDHLVAKDLCGRGFSRVSVLMKSLQNLSESKDSLTELLTNGLTTKLLSWFEVVHDLLTSDPRRSSAPLLTLTEEFYDYFLLLGQASLPVSQLSVVLLHLVRFSLDQDVYFPLRLEAIRTFNSILESLSREDRRQIQKDQNQTLIQSQVAAAVLTGGDYELQVSLSEALCRLTPRKQRQQRANQWFPCRDISSAFCDIRDRDFEVDCRGFLNFVNRFHGDQRRVYTFPCLRAFLDSTELFRPKDDKLDEFWVDFNLNSGCISFFIDEPQGFLWGSVHLLRQEVSHYRVEQTECTAAQTVLRVQLINPIMHHNSRGQTVELSFSRQHRAELEEAAGRVFQRGQSPPPVPVSDGSVRLSPPAGRSSYGRKRRPNRSQLRVLPLSSPSSEEDSSVTKVGDRSHSDSLFDLVRLSTSSYDSGVAVGAEPEAPQVQRHPAGGSSPAQGGSVGDRKRGASLSDYVFLPACRDDVTGGGASSGYLSDQTEGWSTCKRRAEPLSEGEEPDSPEGEEPDSPEGEEPDSPVTGGPPEEEEEGLLPAGASSPVQGAEPDTDLGAEPQCDITSGVTTAFNSFKTQLEEHLTGCWQEEESRIISSLKDVQQQVTSLLTAVHQHRLVSLQTFLIGVSDRLDELKETTTELNSISAHIQRFFQSEMHRLGSFCEQHLDRLKPPGSDPPPSQ